MTYVNFNDVRYRLKFVMHCFLMVILSHIAALVAAAAAMRFKCDPIGLPATEIRVQGIECKERARPVLPLDGHRQRQYWRTTGAIQAQSAEMQRYPVVNAMQLSVFACPNLAGFVEQVTPSSSSVMLAAIRGLAGRRVDKSGVEIICCLSF